MLEDNKYNRTTTKKSVMKEVPNNDQKKIFRATEVYSNQCKEY